MSICCESAPRFVGFPSPSTLIRSKFSVLPFSAAATASENIFLSQFLLFEQQQKQHSSLGILICGIAGSGKSSISKTVFKSTNSSSEFSIFICNSLELEQNPKLLLSKTIHIVLYVIDSTRGIILPYEEHLILDNLATLKVPIAFLLNKLDVSAESQIESIKQQLDSAILHNQNQGQIDCIGVFPVIGSEEGKYKQVEICNFCGSDDILSRRKLKVWKCVSCGKMGEFELLDNGLSHLIEVIHSVLPNENNLKESFDSVQKISQRIKEDESMKIITEAISKEEKLILPPQQQEEITLIIQMIIRLCKIWDVSIDVLFGCERISQEIIIPVMNKAVSTHNTFAFGIVFVVALMKVFSKTLIAMQQTPNDLQKVLEDSLKSIVNIGMLMKIASQIHEIPLEKVFENILLLSL